MTFANGEIYLDWLPENFAISEVFLMQPPEFAISEMSLEVARNFADGLKLTISEISSLQKMQIFKFKALKSQPQAYKAP